MQGQTADKTSQCMREPRANCKSVNLQNLQTPCFILICIVSLSKSPAKGQLCSIHKVLMQGDKHKARKSLAANPTRENVKSEQQHHTCSALALSSFSLLSSSPSVMEEDYSGNQCVVNKRSHWSKQRPFTRPTTQPSISPGKRGFYLFIYLSREHDSIKDLNSVVSEGRVYLSPGESTCTGPLLDVQQNPALV